MNGASMYRTIRVSPRRRHPAVYAARMVAAVAVAVIVTYLTVVGAVSLLSAWAVPA